jgi:hypothetical protein
MTWDEAVQLADRIAESPEAGAWHVRVVVAGEPQKYAVAVRQHNTHRWYHVTSIDAFLDLGTPRRGPHAADTDRYTR